VAVSPTVTGAMIQLFAGTNEISGTADIAITGV
jgi:hypothetical protein